MGLRATKTKSMPISMALSPHHHFQTANGYRLLAREFPKKTRKLLIAYVNATQQKYDPGFPDGPAPKSRLAALRDVMTEYEIDAFLIPRTDEFLGEYVSAYADRLYWLTGFSGSAGLGIVMQDKAAIFVDGRYEIQVANEIDPSQFDICPVKNTARGMA